MAATKTQHETIQQFLELPVESLPSAQYVGDEDGNAWAQLRDWMRPTSQQRINHCGERICLHADRDEWRDGVIVIM